MLHFIYGQFKHKESRVNHKKKILIVDDSPTIIQIIKNFIGDLYPYTPYYASTFLEAKQLIEQEEFYVAILDLELPDAATGAVVDYAITHNILAIVLTGTINKELREKILNKPIVDYLVKNSLEDIKAALEIAKSLSMLDSKIALIVDDSKLARMEIRQFFDRLSIFCIEAANGSEALKCIANSPIIDIITVDNEMPGMNGLQLIQSIRSMHTITQPVIFSVTLSDSALDKANYIKNGANDYFTKPIQKEEFNHKILNYMRLISQYEDLIQAQRIVDEYNRALDAGSYVSKSDPDGIITFVSDKFLELTGYSKNELIGKKHSVLKHHNTPKSLFKELWKTIMNKEIWSGVIKNTKKNGDSFYARTTIVPILNTANEILEYIALRDDVTELVSMQQKNLHFFKTDLLTSLGNRIKLLDDLEIITNPLLAIINIERFKEINAEFGYKIGDEVIVLLGKFLYDYSTEFPIEVYRLNADEYAILSSQMDITTFSNHCEALVTHVNDTPLQIQSEPLHISIKIGISAGTIDTLLHADIALKEAKTISQSIVLYDDSIKASLEYKNNLYWKGKIINGIKNDLFLPYFQPIINNKNGKIEKYEALIRLKDQDKIITPTNFLSVAKKTRTYFELTLLMLRKTFELFKNNDLEFSINFSVEDITNEAIITYFKHMLYQYSGIQKRITIEIVESEGIENFDEMNIFIKQMKEFGCKIAIDDFGTGYSNFEYLMKLNVDYIKIDGSLIREIATNKYNYDVVETIVGFAKKNKIKTIAEFVSNKEIYDLVITLGIDYTQGYYLAEPTEEIIRELL